MMVVSNLSASFKWRSRLPSGMVWITLKNVRTSIMSLDRFPSMDKVPEIAFSADSLSPSSYFCWILSRNNRNLSPYGQPFVDITVNAIFSENNFNSWSRVNLGPSWAVPDSPEEYLLCSFCQLFFSSKITIFISNCVSKILSIFSKNQIFSIFVFLVLE